MEEHKIKLTVDTGNSTKDIEKLNKALEDTQEELVPLTSIMGEMEDKLMLMAHAGDTTSDEFKRLATEVAGMRRTIRETDEGIESLSLTTGQKLGGALQGIASGFEAAQGVMGAFGANSEEVEKALLKVQSAMAIAQGLTGVRESIKDFKALKTDILSSATATNIATGAQKLYNMVVGKSTGAMKALKLAIAASGVGALVLILGEVVSAMMDFGDSTEEAAKKQERLEKQLEATNKQIEASKKKTQDLSAELDLETRKRVANAQLKGKSEEELKLIEQQADLARLAIFEKEIQREKYRAGEIARKKGSAKELEAVIKSQVEAERQYAEQLVLIAEKEAEDIDRIRQEKLDKEKAANDKAREARQKANEDRKQAIEEIQQAEKEYWDSKLSAEALEIKNSTEKYNKLIADAKKYGQDTKVLEQAQLEEVNAIQKKYTEERVAQLKDEYQSKKELRDEAHQKELEDEKAQAEALKELMYGRVAREKGEDEAKYIADKEAIQTQFEERLELFKGNALLEQMAFIEKEDALAELDKNYKQAQIQREVDARNAVAERVKKGLEMVSNIVSLFAGKSKKQQKTAFQIQKGINIATATIDTYMAANSALASAKPPLNFIAAALAIATGLANVMKIARTKFDESGGDSGGGGSLSAGGGAGGGGGAMSTPEFNVVGNSPVAALAQMSTQPQQAFVVSGEVTTAQSLDRNRVSNATL